MNKRYDVFISVHDQDLILQLEKNRCFRNIKKYKYLFLGYRPTDKLNSLKNKVIIARDLPINIEPEKYLFDYTGWYALVKNNLIKKDYVAVIHYDCFVFENFKNKIQNIFKQNKECFINFIPQPIECNYFLEEEFAKAIIEASKKVYNIDPLHMVEDAKRNGDKYWPSGGSFACNKEWLVGFVDWIEKMKPLLVDDPKVSHNIERAFKIYNLAHNVNEIHLDDVLEHIYNCSHDQNYRTEEADKWHKSRFEKYINGELFDKKSNFCKKIFSIEKNDKHKIFKILGIKLKFRRK